MDPALIPFISGAFALGGTAFGFGLKLLDDRLKRKREDALRWSPTVRELGATYLKASDDLLLLTRYMTKPTPLTNSKFRQDFRDLFPGAEEPLGRLFHNYTSLSIVAKPNIVSAATILWDAARDSLFCNFEDLPEAVAAHEKAQKAFISILRHELGVELLPKAKLAELLIVDTRPFGSQKPDSSAEPDVARSPINPASAQGQITPIEESS
ncbi:hypothetical protein [Rathayibacter festucae]|uniref:hypothetical protein n=1 Tax=Rathayibacter festucae TaxID=110937 RepID=UPI000FD7E77B|nr:hypothetical protein [Rathayibacter festucae]